MLSNKWDGLSKLPDRGSQRTMACRGRFRSYGISAWIVSVAPFVSISSQLMCILDHSHIVESVLNPCYDPGPPRKPDSALQLTSDRT